MSGGNLPYGNVPMWYPIGGIPSLTAFYVMMSHAGRESNDSTVTYCRQTYKLNNTIPARDL